MNDFTVKLSGFIEENKLFAANQQVLVAVSGGVDSVVLLHSLIDTGFNVSVAHCNFNLRGIEANGDEAFVKQLCKKLKITLHNESFNTKDIAKHTGESIQMAARRLRYDWFDALCRMYGYAGVATGHNANDVAETFFVNLSRGTGLNGLTGIKAKNGNVVRPILFASRIEIEAYAKANKLKWRNDSSNQSTKYRRNLIRHKVLPVFEKINPSFISSIQATINHLHQSNELLQTIITGQLEDVITQNGDALVVEINKLKKLKPLGLFLFELLHPYGFNGNQIEDIAAALDSISGKHFYSETHELVRDRNFLIIKPLQHLLVEKEYLINDDFNTAGLPIKLGFNVVMNSDKLTLKQPANIALLDFRKIKFPLTLRRRKQGDRFQPFGMKQSKLLSDFIKDNKLSALEKDALWILESNGKIVWIVGYRSDNRFAISAKTTGILQIKLD